MNEDALERLKQQKRPLVKPRTDNLAANEQMVTSSNEQINTRSNEQMVASSNEQVKHDRQLVEVTRKSILLENSVEQKLTAFCKQNNIIIATWIESAFEHLEQQPDLMNDVIATARLKGEERKDSARIRQAQSFSEKLYK